MTIELALLSRVAYREQEITGTSCPGLLALLAGDLRTGCSTGRLVDATTRSTVACGSARRRR